MPSEKLTDRRLRSLAPQDSEYQLGDGGGLWVRVLPKSRGGAVNFYYRYQYGGKERRYNCGTYPHVSLADARDRRNAARALVRRGEDPVEKDRQDKVRRAAELAALAMDKTVQELFLDWKQTYLATSHKDGGKATSDTLAIHALAQLGAMRAGDVRLRHIVPVLDRIVASGKRRTANMVLSQLRQMFRHGLARGLVETDPTLGLSKKHVGGKALASERNLTHDELLELGAKLGAAGLHTRFQAALRLLLATGARVGELSKARWAEIDAAGQTWKIPADNSKNGRGHTIHLSNYARTQLTLLRAASTGAYVLEGRTADQPINEKSLSKAVRDRMRRVALNKRSPQTGTLILTGGEWSVHDLRRTFASRLGDLGVAPHVIERCLNHVPRGIVAVYQRQDYLPERRDALDRLGKYLQSVLAPAPARPRRARSLVAQP